MKIIDNLLKLFGLNRASTKEVKIVEKIIYRDKEAKKVLERTVIDRISTAYILGEISKFTPEQSDFLITATSKELEFLVKIISVFYRKNAVYEYLFQRGYV